MSPQALQGLLPSPSCRHPPTRTGQACAGQSAMAALVGEGAALAPGASMVLFQNLSLGTPGLQGQMRDRGAPWRPFCGAPPPRQHPRILFPAEEIVPCGVFTLPPFLSSLPLTAAGFPLVAAHQMVSRLMMLCENVSHSQESTLPSLGRSHGNAVYKRGFLVVLAR